MSGRCKDCRWWGRSGGLDESRECEHPKIDEPLSGDPDEPQSLDSLRNSDGEYAVWTGPEFGCVHFEKREVENALE